MEHTDQEVRRDTAPPMDVFEPSFQKLVTKQDLEALELKMEEELTLLKWMLGAVLGGVLFLILKAFFVP